MENKRRTGTLCVFLAAVLYSIGGLCIKLIPWGGMAINGARTAIALVVIGAYLAVIRHPLRFNRWVAVGALSIFGTNALFSVANKLTTAANVIVLQFTAPIFVILFSALFWRRKPGRLDLLACGIVFGGVLFFFADSLEMGGGLGNVLALLSGVAYAGVFLMNEMPDSDAISSVFWGDVLSAVTGLPFLLGEEKTGAHRPDQSAGAGRLSGGGGLYPADHRPENHASGDRQPGLRHRAGAQPNPGGGVLSRDCGHSGPGWGGHRHRRRGGL